MTGRDFIEPAVWWAVLFATYLAVISKISVAELVVGALASAAAAGAAVVTRRDGDRLDPEPRARPEDASGDLTAVRNDQPANGHGLHSMQSRNGFGPPRPGTTDGCTGCAPFLLRSSWRR